MARRRYNGLTAELGAALPPSTGASYLSTVLADTPDAYYRLGDTSGSTMTDSSGNGRDGTYVNSPTLDVAGLLSGDSNSSVAFNGSNQYGIVAAGSWMNGNGVWTLEAVIKPTTVSGNRAIAARGDFGNGAQNGWPWVVMQLGDTVAIMNTNSMYNTRLVTGSVLAVGVAAHIVATFDGATYKIYVNGALAASGAGSAGYGGNGNARLTIAADLMNSGGTTQDYFAGTIDEVAFWGSLALSAARVTAHYLASVAAAPVGITFAAALTHSNGTSVPTITAPDYIPLTLLDSTGGLSEIVWLTAYTAGATTGTVVRACEGSHLADHASGDKVVHAPTALDLVGVTGSLLAAVSYNPGTLMTYSTTSATDDDVDATHLAVTFTAPASGNALVTLTALAGTANTGNMYWSLRNGTTRLISAQVLGGSDGTNRAYSMPLLVTGLTPGASYTLKWGWHLAANGSATMYAGTITGTDTTPATMKVEAA